MKARWLLAALAATSLVGAVLFAVLPYTVPVRSNGTNNVECDAAIIQLVGSPKFGPGSASQAPDGSFWSSIENFEPPCDSVAHYRLGISLGLLIVVAVLGVLIARGIRRDRQIAQSDEVGSQLSHT